MWIEVLSANQIVSSSRDQSICVWHFQTGVCIKQLNGQAACVTKVKALLDIQKLVSISHDKTIKVWDLNSNSCEKTFN